MFPYSDAHGQNFKVFWKRSFAQLRVSPKNLCAPGDYGEKHSQRERLTSQSLRLWKGSEVLLSPAFWEATCTDLSMASWLPLQAVPVSKTVHTSLDFLPCPPSAWNKREAQTMAAKYTVRVSKIPGRALSHLQQGCSQGL